MQQWYLLICFLIATVSFLPLINNQHWFFRVWDFGRIQLLVINIILLVFAVVFCSFCLAFFVIITWLSLSILYNLKVLYPYISFGKKQAGQSNSLLSQISILSANVYQFNKDYSQFIGLIRQLKPDIVLTIESNKDWENALTQIEETYPNYCKVALENTYGIHFYSKLKLCKSTINYFVSDDIPSIEVEIETEKGEKFTFFGVHPPPPSPTEETTSKERDGELMMLAKRVNKIKNPVIVVGDFNNVAWAKSSILFRKTSKLIDARIGRGFISTYHAKYWFLQFPIDLVYHSPSINISELKTTKNIGSDHLPIFVQFNINNVKQNSTNSKVTKNEQQQVEELIEKGIEKDGNRDEVATED